jgi:hypothetical protein
VQPCVMPRLNSHWMFPQNPLDACTSVNGAQVCACADVHYTKTVPATAATRPSAFSVRNMKPPVKGAAARTAAETGAC